jgi:hypothetical protein
MDRELHVKEAGYELAQLQYTYDTPTSGKVWIRINRIYDIGDDMKSFYPIYEYESYFNHQAFTSLAALKDYDKDILKQQSDFTPQPGNLLEYIYEPMEYRYVIKHRDAVGIARIKTNFDENMKEMDFLSGRRQKEDITLSSDSFEINKALLKRLCEEYLDCYGADFIPIGWN